MNFVYLAALICSGAVCIESNPQGYHCIAVEDHRLDYTLYEPRQPAPEFDANEACELLYKKTKT